MRKFGTNKPREFLMFTFFFRRAENSQMERLEKQPELVDFEQLFPPCELRFEKDLAGKPITRFSRNLADRRNSSLCTCWEQFSRQ
jgi:hypothetical protein